MTKEQTNVAEGTREQWGSRLGFLLAASGSAIGLGNIWKFPYITGENGGAAFIIVYLISIAIIGIPVMLAEFIIGRNTQKDPIGAYKQLAPKSLWFLNGVMGVAAAFVILSFYSVVAGWTLAYSYKAVAGQLVGVDPAQYGSLFGDFVSDTTGPIFWQAIFMVLTVAIVMGGIKGGIEKWSKILMPALILILVLLIFRSVTLPGASKGLEFLFKPDFSKLTAEGVLKALGHAFFSLSIGMGTMITYGSYLGKKENLPLMAVQVSLFDTIFALMAGLAIFPAVFALGFAPDQSVGLVFITLPAVFAQMPFGQLFGTMFFMLLALAALTSSISLLEVPISYCVDELKLGRKISTVIVGFIIFLLGVPSSLSNGVWSEVKFFGLGFFDLMDFLASNILLPVGGLLIALFMGWYLGREKALKEVTNNGTIEFVLGNIWFNLTRFFAPIAISIIFLNAIGIIKF